MKSVLNIKYISLLMLFFLFFVPVKGLTTEQSQISPDDVFAVAELTDRTLDTLLRLRGIKDLKQLDILEKQLGPMHVYQMLVATADMLIAFEKKEGIRPMPKVVATPTNYTPEDVKLLADILLNEVRRVLYLLNIHDYPFYNDQFSGKTSNDVFEKTLSIFIKLSVLAGIEQITPSEVFAQMVRGVSDVKSILTEIDPAQRFRIDAPVSPSGLIPADVFKECLQIRKDINALKGHFNMHPTPVPEIPDNQKLHPADVFIQTQIIIAELNLLKMRTGTISATPLSIPVSGKVPSNVHQEAAMIRYLLSQIKPLQEMVGMKKKYLKVGYLPILDHLPLLISHARENAAFAHIKTEPKMYYDWNAMVNDLQAGMIDAAFMLSPLAMDLFHAGSDIRSILLAHRDGSAITVKTDSTIKNISDFRGLTIAIPHRKATHTALLDMYLRTGGLSLKDVITQIIAPSNMEAEMTRGTVDAFVVAEPFGTRAQLNGVGKIHILTKDILPHHVECIVVVNQQFLNINPVGIQEWTDSLIRSGKFIDQDKLNNGAKEVAELAATYLPHKPKLITEGLQNPIDRISFSDLNPDISDFEKIMDISVQAEMIPAVNLNGFIEDRFYRSSAEK